MLHNYHDVWKMLPEAQTLDAQGRAMHGWRIRVVPFVEKGMVYARHTFNEPWDGPANLRLHGIPLAYFACPLDPSWPGPNVSYLAVVGNETAWPAEQGTRFRDFRDGLSNSLMVVEAAQSGIHWLEPRDLAFDEFDYTINSDSGRGIRSEHPGGANVLYADGSVRWMSVATPPDVLRSLLTIAGGEEIPED